MRHTSLDSAGCGTAMCSCRRPVQGRGLSSDFVRSSDCQNLDHRVPSGIRQRLHSCRHAVMPRCPSECAGLVCVPLPNSAFSPPVAPSTARLSNRVIGATGVKSQISIQREESAIIAVFCVGGARAGRVVGRASSEAPSVRLSRPSAPGQLR
jgi:hypothetical protein